MEVIRFENATIGYDSMPVQENLNFSVHQGEFWAVVGPNGTGKTTLVKTILGLLPPLSGKVYVFGCPATHVCHHRKLIGYVPQIDAVDSMFPATALDIVLTGLFASLGPFRRITREHKDNALKLLNEVGVADKKDWPFAKLSGGQKRRVLIARALIGHPRILILDEPTAGVDVASEEKLVKLIADIHRERKLTTLFITHNVNPILPYIDKVIVLGVGFYAVGDKEVLFDQKLLQKVYGREVQIVCTPDDKRYILPEDHHHAGI